MRTRTSSKITDAFIFLDERWKMWLNRMKRRQMWGNICYRLQQTSHNHDFKSVCQWKRRIRIRTTPEPNWNHNIDQNKTSMIYFVLFSCCIISETPVRRICLVVSSQIGITKNRRIQQNRVFRVQNPEQNQQNRSVTAGGVVSDPSLCFCVRRCRDVTSWTAECDIKPAPVHIIFNWLVL